MKRIALSLCVIATMLILVTSFAGFCLSQSKPAQAAAPPTQQGLKVTEIKVNPGMDWDFIGFVKANVVPAMTKLGIKDFSVWKIDQFGDTNTFFFITPLQKLSELDKPANWVQVLGQETVGTLYVLWQRLVASSREYALEDQPALSLAEKPGYAYKIGVLATNIVAPGREAEFETATKAIMALVGKTNAKGFSTRKFGLGGNSNEYVTFVPFDSFTDLGQFEPALIKALAGGKFPAETPGVVTYRKYEVVRLIPELSIDARGKPAAK